MYMYVHMDKNNMTLIFNIKMSSAFSLAACIQVHIRLDFFHGSQHYF